MKLPEFKEKRIGKYGKDIDIDGAFGGQCVDLGKLALRDLYNIVTVRFYGSAKNAFENDFLRKKGFKRIKKDEGFKPNRGDLVFYNYGDNGHVAIVLDSDDEGVRILEANVGNGNGYGYDDRVIENKRGYNNVLGWYDMQYKEGKGDFYKLKEEYIRLEEEFENYKLKIQKEKDGIYKEIEEIEMKVKRLKSKF